MGRLWPQGWHCVAICVPAVSQHHVLAIFHREQWPSPERPFSSQRQLLRWEKISVSCGEICIQEMEGSAWPVPSSQGLIFHLLVGVKQEIQGALTPHPRDMHTLDTAVSSLCRPITLDSREAPCAADSRCATGLSSKFSKMSLSSAPEARDEILEITFKKELKQGTKVAKDITHCWCWSAVHRVLSLSSVSSITKENIISQIKVSILTIMPVSPAQNVTRVLIQNRDPHRGRGSHPQGG